MLPFKAIVARRLREHPDWVPASKDDHGAEAIARFLQEREQDAAGNEAEVVLERVIEEFGDLRRPRSPRTLGEVAAGELNAMRNLGLRALTDKNQRSAVSVGSAVRDLLQKTHTPFATTVDHTDPRSVAGCGTDDCAE